MKWRFLFRKKREKKLDPDLYYSEVKARIIPGGTNCQEDFYRFQSFGIQSTLQAHHQSRPRTLQPVVQLPSYTSGDFSIQSSAQDSLADEEGLAYCPNCHTLVHPISKRRPKIRTNPWLSTSTRQEEVGFPRQSASVTDSGISELVAQSEGSGGVRREQFPKSVSDTFTTLLTPQEEEQSQSFIAEYDSSPKGPQKIVESSDENSANEREFYEKQPRRIRRRKKQHPNVNKVSRRIKSPMEDFPIAPTKAPAGFLQFSSSEHSTPVHKMNYNTDTIDVPLQQNTSYLSAHTPSYIDQAYENESLFSDTQTNISREAYVNYRRMRGDDLHSPKHSPSFRHLSDKVESLEELRLRLQHRIDQLHSDKLRLEAQFSRASLTQDLLSQEIDEYRHDLVNRVQSQQHPSSSYRQEANSRRSLAGCSTSHVISSAEQYLPFQQHPAPNHTPVYGNRGITYNPPTPSAQPHYDNFLYSQRSSQLMRDQRLSSHGYTDCWGYTLAS